MRFAETIVGLFMTAMIPRRRPWQGPKVVQFAILEWVHWVNHCCLPEPIGNIPAAQAEALCYESLEAPPRQRGDSSNTVSGKAAAVQPAASFDDRL